MITTQAQPVAVADPSRWDCPTLDTDAHIEESLGQPISLPDHLRDLIAEHWCSDPEVEDALCAYFAALTGGKYVQQLRDNSYNHEQDLSQQVVFSIYAPADCADWCWCHDVFVVIENHQGGDVRGNYGVGTVYRVDNIGESGFLEWVVGWYARPICDDAYGDVDDPDLQRANERLSVGYSSHPTSELRRLLMPNTEPAWSDRLGCYVARLADVPFAVRLEPTTPYYCG
jgi:hypothetical protein